MDILDWILLAAVLGLAGLALWRWRKSRGCCGGCQGCAMAGSCQKNQEKQKKRS